MQSSRNSNSVGAVLNRQFRNYQVCQQCLLIALLNQYGEIQISKEKKRSNVTLPFFTVDYVCFENNDKIDITQFIEKRCYEQRIKDIKEGISEKTAQRRFKSNKAVEILHLLMDIVSEFQQCFETKTSVGKNGAKKMETIISCNWNGNYYDQNAIELIGMDINAQLYSLISNNNSIVLPRGCINLN